MSRIGLYLVITLTVLNSFSLAFAQGTVSSGAISGTVTLQPAGTAARGALITIVELKQSVLTDVKGAFVFESIPVGKYQIIAHLDRVPDVVKTITTNGANQTIDLELTLAPVSEQVIVTASGSAEALASSYQAVSSISALDLLQKNAISIGEALEFQNGIAKRSFGPGSGRPVILGVDGDRVLAFHDG